MKKKEEKEVKRHELISCEANGRSKCGVIHSTFNNMLTHHSLIDVEKKAIEIVEVCLKKDVDVRCSFANDELTISTTDVNNGVQEEHAKGQNDIENDKAINGRPNSSRSICKQQSESSSPSPSPSTTGSTGTNVHATEFVPVRSTIVKQSIALDPLTLANSNTTLISPNDCPNLNFHIPMSDGTMIPLDSHAPVPAIFSWPNVPYAAVNLPSPPMFFLVGADGMPVLGSMPLPWFATDTTTGEPVIMLPPAPDAVCGPPVHTEPSRPSVYALPPSLAQCFPFGCPRLGFGNALFVPVPHELWIACPLSPEVKAQYGW